MHTNDTPDDSDSQGKKPKRRRRSGQDIKRDELSNLEARYGHITRLGRHKMLGLFLSGMQQVVACDLHEVFQVPADCPRQIFGTIPSALARYGCIRHVGYRLARRREAHARIVYVWELADREKCLSWIAENLLPESGMDAEKGAA